MDPEELASLAAVAQAAKETPKEPLEKATPAKPPKGILEALKVSPVSKEDWVENNVNETLHSAAAHGAASASTA